MTHFTVDYSKLEGQAKIDAALEDIKLYLGIRKMTNLEEIVKTELSAGRIKRFSFIMQLSVLAGIQGYPAQAWADHLGFPPYTDEEIKILEEM